MPEALYLLILLCFGSAQIIFALMVADLYREVRLLRDDHLSRLILDRLTAAAGRQRGMKQALLEDGKQTRERIAQVKTRLADEERQDQAQKRRERRR